jgi:glycosyltransferase involved in cell wall biosynthesis
MAYELGHQLAVHGHDVHLITTNSGGLKTDQESLELIDAPSQGFSKAALKILLKLKASSKLEVVHVQNLAIHRSLTPLISALRRKGNLPIVAYCCQLPSLSFSNWIDVLRKDPGEAFSSKLGMLAPPFTAYWSMKIASKAVASSQFIGEELARFVPADRVEIVPPFLRSDRLTSRQKTAGKRNEYPRVLYLGSHKALRGEEDFLLAMSLLKKEYPTIEGIAVTPHPLPHRIESMVRKLGLDGRIAFPPRNVPLDVLSLIESSDLYMFTGLSPVGSIDPPLTIIESLILGTPVASYDTGGIKEILNGNNLAPYHNYTALAKTASEILQNHPSRKPRPDLLTTYGSENAAKKFERIYQELI